MAPKREPFPGEGKEEFSFQGVPVPRFSFFRSKSLFDPTFVGAIEEHPASPPEFIIKQKKGWCEIYDTQPIVSSHYESLVLLPSIVEGVAPDVTVITEFTPMIRKLVEKEIHWTNLKFRGSSNITLDSRWNIWVELCLEQFAKLISDVDMAEAIRVSIGTINRHNSMMLEALSRWCPDTNTFFTRYGEVGITLWEFVTVSKLPTEGDLYEEYTPYNREIDTLPSVTQGLFHIYAMFNVDKVSYGSWVDYFLESLTEGAHKRLSGKKSSQESTKVEKRGYKQRVGISNNIFLAGMYAAFLSGFAFPCNYGERIRPGTFIAAGKLAMGKRVNLSIPGLCCLYSGMRALVNHGLRTKEPGNKAIYFPIQYLNGWLCLHFMSIYHKKEVRLQEIALLNSLKDQRIIDVPRPDAKFYFENNFDFLPAYHFAGKTLVDDGTLSGDVWTYFCSLRSGTLAWRREGHFYVEAYNAHRMARQFACHQLIPRLPTDAQKRGITKDRLEIKSHYLYFVRSGTGSRASIPPKPTERPLFDYDFARWWTNSCSHFLVYERNSLLSHVSYDNGMDEVRVGDHLDKELAKLDTRHPFKKTVKEKHGSNVPGASSHTPPLSPSLGLEKRTKKRARKGSKRHASVQEPNPSSSSSSDQGSPLRDFAATTIDLAPIPFVHNEGFIERAESSTPTSVVRLEVLKDVDGNESMGPVSVVGGSNTTKESIGEAIDLDVEVRAFEPTREPVNELSGPVIDGATMVPSEFEHGDPSYGILKPIEGNIEPSHENNREGSDLLTPFGSTTIESVGPIIEARGLLTLQGVIDEPIVAEALGEVQGNVPISSDGVQVGRGEIMQGDKSLDNVPLNFDLIANSQSSNTEWTNVLNQVRFEGGDSMVIDDLVTDVQAANEGTSTKAEPVRGRDVSSPVLGVVDENSAQDLRAIDEAASPSDEIDLPPPGRRYLSGYAPTLMTHLVESGLSSALGLMIDTYFGPDPIDPELAFDPKTLDEAASSKSVEGEAPPGSMEVDRPRSVSALAGFDSVVPTDGGMVANPEVTLEAAISFGPVEIPEIGNDVEVMADNTSPLQRLLASARFANARSMRAVIMRHISTIGPRTPDLIEAKNDALEGLALIERDLRNDGLRHAVEMYFDTLIQGTTLERQIGATEHDLELQADLQVKEDKVKILEAERATVSQDVDDTSSELLVVVDQLARLAAESVELERRRDTLNRRLKSLNKQTAVAKREAHNAREELYGKQAEMRAALSRHQEAHRRLLELFKPQTS